MIEEEYNTIGKKIDKASDHGDIDTLNELITECSNLNLNEDSPTLLYFIANIFSALRHLSESEKSINAWEWNSDYRKKELLNLRKAIQHNKFKDINAARRCQIHTNLGNLLSNTGRFIEAFDEWEKALRIFPKFSMALIQIPHCLFNTYSQIISDDGHKYLFYQKIYDHYSIDLDKLEYPLESHAVNAVKEEQQRFCKWWNAVKDDAFKGLQMYYNKIEDYNIPLGRSNEERLYREWCLQNKLFINPLNDLGNYSFAARDIYHIGNTKCKIGHGPWFHYMFDQMKQEFIAARYMLFCALNKFSKSYVDKDVSLTDTLDWPVYGFDVEQIKISYRITYGILDKIAYFLNKYFDLGNKEQSFRNVWYKNTNYNEGLDNSFQNLDNLPLRGLFWLGKDLVSKNIGSDEIHHCLEPQAQELSNIRNSLEHEFVRITEYGKDISSVWKDDPAKTISKNEMINKALYLQKLIRSALMYLGMGVSIEEAKKESFDNTLDVTVAVPIYKQ